MIAEALVPVFFVMFLGYFAGARRIIDNQQVASLTVLVMTLALPAALFVGVAQTSRSGLEENGKLVLVLVISMLVIFGITFSLNHYIFRLSPGENAVQSLSVGFPNLLRSACPCWAVSWAQEARLARPFRSLQARSLFLRWLWRFWKRGERRPALHLIQLQPRSFIRFPNQSRLLSWPDWSWHSRGSTSTKW